MEPRHPGRRSGGGAAGREGTAAGREEGDGSPSPVRDPWPVGIPGDMPASRRRAYRAVLVYFVTVVAALMWPVYELAAGIEPRVLGVPFSLAYLVILLLGSFTVLLGLYLWEGRRFGDGHEGEPGG